MPMFWSLQNIFWQVLLAWNIYGLNSDTMFLSPLILGGEVAKFDFHIIIINVINCSHFLNVALKKEQKVTDDNFFIWKYRKYMHN